MPDINLHTSLTIPASSTPGNADVLHRGDCGTVTVASLDSVLGVCSAFFYNFFFIYWSAILFVLRIQIGIDLYTIIDKVLY